MSSWFCIRAYAYISARGRRMYVQRERTVDMKEFDAHKSEEKKEDDPVGRSVKQLNNSTQSGHSTDNHHGVVVRAWCKKNHVPRQ